MSQTKKQATFTFPKSLNRPKETHEVVKEGGYWRMAGAMEPLRSADLVVTDDGEVVKKRHG